MGIWGLKYLCLNWDRKNAYLPSVMENKVKGRIKPAICNSTLVKPVQPGFTICLELLDVHKVSTVQRPKDYEESLK